MTADTGIKRIVHLYLSTTFSDMSSERRLLNADVVPALSRYSSNDDIVVELIDLRKGYDNEPEAELNALNRGFDEIREKHPILLCILGERYGFVPKEIPEEIAGKEPWIREYLGFSVNALEVLYSILDQKRVEHAFFYFRDSHYLADILESTTPSDFVSEHKDCKAKLKDLKTRIRNSGFPVREYENPIALAEMIRKDLTAFLGVSLPDFAWKEENLGHGQHWGIWGISGADEPPKRSQADSLHRSSKEETNEPSKSADIVTIESDENFFLVPPVEVRQGPSPYVYENAQFTVYRPKVVKPDKWYPLIAFAHLSEKPVDAPEDEPDPIEEVKRQASQILGEDLAGFQDLTQDSSEAIPRGGQITFVPEIPNIVFNPSYRTFSWEESVHREEFRFRASQGLDGQVARGSMSVFWGNILVAEVRLSVRVESRELPKRSLMPLETNRATVYRKIFASYSHRDVPIVEEFQHYVQAVGDEFLRDMVHLRSGEAWGDQLRKMISQADIFQLFWSWNSIKSDYVEQEWKYALSLNRSLFVRPVYWEDPMPELREKNVPPEELRRLHFQRIYPFVIGSDISRSKHSNEQAMREQRAHIESSPAKLAEFSKKAVHVGEASGVMVKAEKKNKLNFSLLKNVFLGVMLVAPQVAPLCYLMVFRSTRGFGHQRLISFINPNHLEPSWFLYGAFIESTFVILIIEWIFLAFAMLGRDKILIKENKSFKLLGLISVTKKILWLVITLAISIIYPLTFFLPVYLDSKSMGVDEESVVAIIGNIALARFIAVWIIYAFVRWILIGSIKAWRNRKAFSH